MNGFYEGVWKQIQQNKWKEREKMLLGILISILKTPVLFVLEKCVELTFKKFSSGGLKRSCLCETHWYKRVLKTL